MGWDVMILNTKDTLQSPQIDKSSLPSFGQRQAMIDNLNRLFPNIEWDEDLAYGHLNNEVYVGNIGLGESEKMTGYFWLGIYGGTNPFEVIMKLCDEYRSSAFDTVTSEYITIDKPSDKGWKHFQDFRNYVAERLGNSDKGGSEGE